MHKSQYLFFFLNIFFCLILRGMVFMFVSAMFLMMVFVFMVLLVFEVHVGQFLLLGFLFLHVRFELRLLRGQFVVKLVFGFDDLLERWLDLITFGAVCRAR